MNVLAIGNSFSQDATRYLSQIARAQGVHLDVVNLYIGGCSLETHYRNILGDKREYLLEVNGQQTGFFVSLKEALLSRKWDAVTLQQVSHLSFKKETYYPYIVELVDRVKAYQPKARLLLQETWSYEEGSDRLATIAGYDTAKAMLRDIQATYAEVAAAEGFDGVIPSGTLFGMMLDEGIQKLHRDGFHATLGLGRYALGLLWFGVLTGQSVAENVFCDLDACAGDNEMAIAKKCVEKIICRKNI